MRYMIGSILTLIMLSGCETGSLDPIEPIKPVTPIVDTFCALYIPVYTASGDTEQTRDAVDKNNAVWLERCLNEAPVDAN